MGTALGVVAAFPAVKRWVTRVPQWLAGGVALAVVTAAWVFALGS